MTGHAPPPLGTVLSARYRLVRELGRGGMGVVFGADDLQAGGSVAIKLLLEPTRATMLERFQREAEVVAQLTSPHVCGVHDVGTTQEGVPYIAMEWLDGLDLHDLQEQRGRVPWAEMVVYVVQALDAIGEAHLRGVVHRDLKPANLFVTRRPDGSPHVKVLDFGISKVGAKSHLTGTRDVLGSPGFMAPEQLRHRVEVDHRADLWGLGTVMYQLVAGEPPFDAETVGEVLVRILEDEPTSLGILCGDLPHGLRAVIERCLQKNADSRFESAAELALALRPFTAAATQPLVDRLVAAYEAKGWKRSTPSPRAVIAPQGQGPATAEASTLSAPAWSGPTQLSTETAQPQATAHAPVHGPAAQAVSGETLRSPEDAPARRAPWGVIALVVGALGIGGLGWAAGSGALSGEDEGASTEDEPSPRRRGRRRRSKPTKAKPVSSPRLHLPSLPSSGPFPREGDDVYAKASLFLDDAIERNGGANRLYFVKYYRSGFVQVALRAHDKPQRVMRYEYKNGGLYRDMPYSLSSDERRAMPEQLFTLDPAVIERIRADAMRRSAHAGTPREIFMIAGDVARRGKVTFYVIVHGPDLEPNFEYDGQGRFAKNL